MESARSRCCRPSAFPPFLRGDEARQQADGEDLLRPAVVVVDGEGHALVEQRTLGERLAASELQRRAAVERVDRAAESGAGLSLAVEQLVPDAGETAVAAEQVHGHSSGGGGGGWAPGSRRKSRGPGGSPASPPGGEKRAPLESGGAGTGGGAANGPG